MLTKESDLRNLGLVFLIPCTGVEHVRGGGTKSTLDNCGGPKSTMDNFILGASDGAPS